MSKKVLLTGATGFLGGYTVRALEKAGWDIICCVRGGRHTKFGNETVICDLNKPEEILTLKNYLRADAIIHLACLVGLDGSNDEQLFVPNVLSTGYFAYLAHEWKSRLIFSSTAIVHGIRTKKIDDESPIKSDSAYGKSKALGEQLIIFSGIEYSILRIAGIFGYNGPKHLGINRAITDALNGNRPILIGSGDALRNYIYVEDAAKIIVDVLEENIAGIHLLSGSEILTVKDMLNSICEVFLLGISPIIQNGIEAQDQVITPSSGLPQTRCFREALVDILKKKHSCV